jgi:hypothetical protein
MKMSWFWLRIMPAFALILGSGAAAALGQEEDESAETKQYREDYERIQKVTAISDPAKKADALLQFIRERPNSKIMDYAQGNFFQILEGNAKAGRYPVVITLAEKLTKLRPRVGETYYFLGAALKNTGKMPEAMDALAKCTVLRNPASRKAREFLEFIYRGLNKASLVGLDKLIKKAEAEIGG